MELNQNNKSESGAQPTPLEAARYGGRVEFDEALRLFFEKQLKAFDPSTELIEKLGKERAEIWKQFGPLFVAVSSGMFEKALADVEKTFGIERIRETHVDGKSHFVVIKMDLPRARAASIDIQHCKMDGSIVGGVK